MNFQLPDTDLWKNLQKSHKKIVMYGMGNGADKILAVCSARGIEVSDFFASDGFVRGHSFHGKRVLHYSEAKEKYGAENMIVLLSFASSRPEVLETIRRIASECELYAPDVPVCGDDLFDLDFARAHEEELSHVQNLLCDEESRHIFRNILFYKLTGDIALLFNAESDKATVYRDLLHAERFRTTADLGAYNGDTIRELIPFAPHLSKVFAMEPDRRNYRKLTEFSSGITHPELVTCQAAAWSEDTRLSFGDEGNRNSGIRTGQKSVEVHALPPDMLFGKEKIDYIKFDVEGAEQEALLGCSDTIRTNRPALLISAYHRSEDLFALPLLVEKEFPGYTFYLRRYPYIPAWDLNLICL